MWISTMITLSCGFIAQVMMSHGIKVDCKSDNTIPIIKHEASASLLNDLKVEIDQASGRAELRIQWAVNVDASNKYLIGTSILVDDKSYLCEYTPSLANANLTGITQLWFEFNAPEPSPGLIVVSAANLPRPPPSNGFAYKTAQEMYLPITNTHEPESVYIGSTQKSSRADGAPAHADWFENHRVPLVVLGAALACSVIAVSCLILRKAYRPTVLASGDFSILPVSSEAPVSVLLVYPAECPAVQTTVVALAEFLQEHAGCSVAVDIWQQGQIAELGPMCWLAGQAKAADRVLVVCPQPIRCCSNHAFLGPSIPASANDLYPLVLNMVASHAKNPSELAMFWAVQLGKSRERGPRSHPAELTACKFFSLTKDLNTLCRSLHNKKQGSWMRRRPNLFYNKNSVMKLQEAIGQLAEHQSSIIPEQEPFKSQVITV